MQKVTHTTSRFGFGTMIHAVHMTDDVKALDDFYEDVFGGLLYMGIDEPNYLPPEKRWASLVMISDMCVETMGPEFPVDVQTPVGKFYDRFGSHWHSIGYAIENFAELGKHLSEQGVFMGKPGGGVMEDFDEYVYFYPHPKDTGGVMVECCKVEMMNDPRNDETWSSLRKLWEAHPLGLVRTGWITIGVKDLATSLELWERLFEVERVHEELSPLGHKSQLVHFGDVLIELAEPLDADTPLGRHVAKYGNMIYETTMKVLDVDRAEAHLNAKGVRTTRPTADTVQADPEDCFGAPWAFTTRTIPNDPFDRD